MAKRINYAYLISFLNLSDHFSIGGINCWKCFSTYRITPFVVNEKLKSRKKIKQRMKMKYYNLIWVYDIWYDIGKLTICVVSLAEWNINKRKIQRGKNLVYVSIFFIRLWSVGTAVIFDTQNPEISGFCACVQIQNQTSTFVCEKHRKA